MIYLLLFLILFYGVLRYDLFTENLLFCSKNDNIYESSDFIAVFNEEKRKYYFFILLLFIVMSGCSYKVGSDINAYMAEFAIISLDDLKDINFFSLANKQPLWLFFEFFCKSIINDFAFMKFIISLFVCISFFDFFKTNSKHFFSILLAYYVMMSFDINFNILRQSISMALFLISYRYLLRHKFFFSYLLILLAVLFHNSAIVLIFVPLISRLNVFRHPMLIFFSTIGTALVLTLFLSYSGLIQGLSLFIHSEEFNSLALLYDNSEYGSTSVRLISVFVYLVFIAFIYWGLIKFEFSNDLIWMFLIYSFFFFLSYGIPVFGRIKLYFIPFYIIAVTEFIYKIRVSYEYDYSQVLSTLSLLFLFMFPSIRYFFIKNPRYDDIQIVQYYPYHSIFDKRVEPKRELLFPANY